MESTNNRPESRLVATGVHRVLPAAANDDGPHHLAALPDPRVLGGLALGVVARPCPVASIRLRVEASAHLDLELGRVLPGSA